MHPPDRKLNLNPLPVADLGDSYDEFEDGADGAEEKENNNSDENLTRENSEDTGTLRWNS